MLVQGSLMHVNESVTSDLFLRFLASQAPSAHYFLAQPPEGIIMTAALGWRVVVPDLCSMEALSAALWKGYDTLVRPLHDDGMTRSPHIFIKMNNAKGEYDQFTIGKELKKKEVVCHRMRESAAVLLSGRVGEGVEKELETTNGSDYWLKVP